MAKLTDLPDEILLYISAAVSPLYIDSFVLSCKRFYSVGIDTVRAHDLVRSRLRGPLLGSEPHGLLRSILQDSDMTLCPLSFSFLTPVHGSRNDNVPQDLVTKINLQIAKSPHPGFPKVIDSRHKAEDIIVPLLITRLLNLRKLDFFGVREPYLLDTISGIVEASRHKGRSMNEPLALGRLTDVSINARNKDTDALHLAVLLSMIPTVRRLNASRLSCNESYTFPYKFHGSSVRNMSLDGCIDPSFVKGLIMSTHDLQSFNFTLLIEDLTQNVVFQRLSEVLLQHAGASLLHLSLLIEGCRGCGGGLGLCARCSRIHIDLSLGSLRGFRNLKTLTTRVDMFIRTNDSNSHAAKTGTVKSLVSWLPASLEALVLHKGFQKWSKSVLHKLFRGLPAKKQTRLPTSNSSTLWISRSLIK